MNLSREDAARLLNNALTAGYFYEAAFEPNAVAALVDYWLSAYLSWAPRRK